MKKVLKIVAVVMAVPWVACLIEKFLSVRIVSAWHAYCDWVCNLMSKV